MQWLSRLFKRSGDGEAQPGPGGGGCPHLMVVPTWSNPEDMGNEAKASGYRCYACGASLTLEEGRDRDRRKL